jgi:hypothetical protein
MSKQGIAELVEALGDIPAVLAEAAPQDKFQLYSELGLHLTYEPARRLVRAETGISATSGNYGSCPTGTRPLRARPQPAHGFGSGMVPGFEGFGCLSIWQASAMIKLSPELDSRDARAHRGGRRGVSPHQLPHAFPGLYLDGLTDAAIAVITKHLPADPIPIIGSPDSRQSMTRTTSSTVTQTSHPAWLEKIGGRACSTLRRASGQTGIRTDLVYLQR